MGPLLLHSANHFSFARWLKFFPSSSMTARWKYLHHQWCRTCYQWGKLCLCITAPRCPWSAATQRFDEGGMLQSADKTITAGAKLSLCCIEFHAVCMELYIADKLSDGVFGWSTRFSKQCMSALSAHALLQCEHSVRWLRVRSVY